MVRGDWWGSFTDEIYNNGPFDTEQEIIDEMVCQSILNIGEPEPFNIGQAEPCEVPKVRGDDVLEFAREAAYEDAGEAAESWLDSVSKDQEKELTDALTDSFHKWLEKHDFTPTHFIIDNITTIMPDHPGVVEHLERCEGCKKKRAEYAEGMKKAGEEIQKIIDQPSTE